jgi:hypothetical protein
VHLGQKTEGAGVIDDMIITCIIRGHGSSTASKQPWREEERRERQSHMVLPLRSGVEQAGGRAACVPGRMNPPAKTPSTTGR